MLKKIMYILAAGVGGVFMATSPAMASHSWGSYHWARTTNQFSLKLGDNVSSNWDSHLGITSSDWSVSAVLDTTVVPGGTSSRQCRATRGRVEVCNYTYGTNGWLGIASISVRGGHITQGTVRLNDSYFNAAPYNTPAWRNLVMCQEVGHTFGLDHQDEDFDNSPLGSCMDYTNDPTLNQHPNQHDYDQLAAIYGHFDGSTTVSQQSNGVSGQVQASEPGEWGKLVRQKGRTAVFEHDLGHGHKVFTFVIYA